MRLPFKFVAITVLSIAGLFAASAAQAACTVTDNCGTVTDVRTIKIKGQTNGTGAVIGGVLGGVLGHQVGKGRGKDVATVAGAAGGAFAGNETEKNVKSRLRYRVLVKLENGQSRTFTYNAATSYRVGDRIRVDAGRLVRL
jgi:outer membrane lipoprotein SlyB